MSAIKDRIREVNAEIDADRQKAQDQWKTFADIREKLVESGEDVKNTESEAFQKAESAHKEYATTIAELQRKEGLREKLYVMGGEDGPKADHQRPPTPAEADASKFAGGDIPGQRKTMADRIIEGDQWKQAVKDGKFSGSDDSKIGRVALGKAMDALELKALITGASDTSGGAFVEADRQGYYPKISRPLMLTDLITVGTTDSDLVEFVRQTTQTNAAVEVAEATSASDGAKPESTYAFEVVQQAVKTIAHWVPATRRALRDAGQLRTIIDGQLRNGLEQRLETQMVAGNGSGENLRGIVNTTGVGSYAKGTVVGESTADAIHRAITVIRLTFQEPNGVALHPNDWQEIRLSRDDSGAGAGTGGYLWGPPSQAGPQMIWGLPVAVGAQFPENTGLVGDFRQAILWLHDGIQILSTDSHSDFFVRNIIVVLAEMAAAFGVPRPDAFCKVTSI